VKKIDKNKKRKKKPAGGIIIPEREKVQVRDIQFAYNNHEVIALLQKRG
jgi:hypothetical protein